MPTKQKVQKKATSKRQVTKQKVSVKNGGVPKNKLANDAVLKFPARVAAEVVLVEADKPMHYRDIARTALEQGIVKVKKGATEDQTIKTIRSFLAGSTADGVRFTRVEPGVFKPRNRAQAAARVRKAKEAAKAS